MKIIYLASIIIDIMFIEGNIEGNESTFTFTLVLYACKYFFHTHVPFHGFEKKEINRYFVWGLP